MVGNPTLDELSNNYQAMARQVREIMIHPRIAWTDHNAFSDSRWHTYHPSQGHDDLIQVAAVSPLNRTNSVRLPCDFDVLAVSLRRTGILLSIRIQGVKSRVYSAYTMLFSYHNFYF